MKLKAIEEYKCEGKVIGSVGDELEVEPIVYTKEAAAPHIRLALKQLARLLLGLNNQVEAANPNNPEKWADEVVITIKLK